MRELRLLSVPLPPTTPPAMLIEPLLLMFPFPPNVPPLLSVKVDEELIVVLFVTFSVCPVPSVTDDPSGPPAPIVSPPPPVIPTVPLLNVNVPLFTSAPVLNVPPVTASVRPAAIVV